MTVTLYNHMNSLPRERGDHVFVFTGRAFDENGEPDGIATVASCTYSIGEQTVSFRRNMDSASQRFEYTLKWAIKCAATFGIEDIHAVFELKRELNEQFLSKMCPDGFIDMRPRKSIPCAAAREHSQPAVMTPRRRLVFRNRNIATSAGRAFVTA